ncbi:MAG: hypothetical protein Q7N95_07365 [Alphaproteobacteria bacterium]|nr:hypothetical protein [Alphaproteobacteria bacterium]
MAPIFRRGYGAYVYVIIAVFSSAGTLSAAAEPVALVLDIVGEVTPQLEAFSEIQAGKSFDLGASGRMDFLHYPTCQKVLVEGGRLSLSAENFRVNKGKVIDMTRAECPQRVQMASVESGSGIAGVVLRSAADGALKVSQRPSFLLLGASASQFSQLQVMQGKNSLLKVTLDNMPLAWPETLDPLTTEGEYSVLLTGPDNLVRVIPLAVTRKSKQEVPAIIQME